MSYGFSILLDFPEVFMQLQMQVPIHSCLLISPEFAAFFVFL